MEIDSATTENLGLSEQSYVGRPKFLIVEDDLTSREIWKAIISKAAPNAVVFYEATAEAAAELIQMYKHMEDPFDVVVSDIGLEGSQTGVDLCLEQNENTKHFILATGIDPIAFVKLIGQRRFKYVPHVLKKPFPVDRVVERIQKMLLTESTEA